MNMSAEQVDERLWGVVDVLAELVLALDEQGILAKRKLGERLVELRSQIPEDEIQSERIVPISRLIDFLGLAT